MLSVYFFKTLRLLPLLALPFVAWLIPPANKDAQGELAPEKVNLALRRTADALLRLSGDSTSRIPAIEQSGAGVWQVRLGQPFHYEQLPALLQESLDRYGIRQPYEVAVRRCSDSTVDLGYHQLDYTQNKEVPCGGREMPEGCHFIELKFLETPEKSASLGNKIGIILLVLGGIAGVWFFNRKRSLPDTPAARGETDWLEFGQSRLDVDGQVLLCGGVRQTLTFREAKLMRLFANNPDKLLERDLILRQVWADEGILVGRSVDVFVSRLRKKLAADPTIGIVAVHGVGYRLETGKAG